MINEVTRVVITEGSEKCQVLGNFHKSNQDNNASSTQHNQNNIEEVVDLLTSEESINVFLARQRLRFVKENLNKQEMKDLIIDIMAISETNINYQQEYYINQDIKSKVYSIIFSERDQKTKGSGTALECDS
uniref:Uncharacterized protein n=1 Tax=Rhizophagus irregularis (strain DAOM 181602 / DAOM 197198 / MUCL 43194) TaxID=747089 RepID=U9T328_RHIID